MGSRKYTDRLFLAIELPRFAREQILDKRKKWRKKIDWDVRWIPPLNLRLALRYLGEIEVSKSKQLCRKIETLTGKTPPFQLTVDQVGGTPTNREAKSIWLSFEETSELKGLLKGIETASKELQLPKDKKPFKPRITLSRLATEPQSIPNLTIKPEFKGFKVKSLALVESRMGQNGPSYHQLKKFELLGSLEASSKS